MLASRERRERPLSYVALVAQHTTQLLLSRVEQRIAELEDENYEIHVAPDKRRLQNNATSVQGADGLYHMPDENYADARTEQQEEIVVREFVAALDSTQTKTLTKINSQLVLLLRGQSVRVSKVKAVLTEEQCADYDASLSEARHANETLYGDGMPDELRSYNALLSKADFLHNKKEKMAGLKSAGRRKYKPDTLIRTEQQAESLYELALERLAELFSVATGWERATLEAWLDREGDFSADDSPNLDPDSVPRVRGSRSPYAEDAELPKLSKRLKRTECQLRALRDAACTIAFLPLASQDEGLPEKIKELRDRRRSESRA